LENITLHDRKKAMDRKNINRGFNEPRGWQDPGSLYILACKASSDFPFELKKVGLLIALTLPTASPETSPKATVGALGRRVEIA